MIRKDKLNIAVIGIASLQRQVIYLNDPMLYHGLMLMSRNLAQVTYSTDEQGFDTTTPLHFNFTSRPLIFRKHRPETQSW